MRLKALLQGRWLGHPLHPATVHLPLGAWLCASLFDLGSLAKPGEPLARAADYANRTAVVAALPAMAAGLADYVDIKDRATARKATLHLGLNVAAFGLALTAWRLRAAHPHAVRTPRPALAAQLAATGLLIVSGYIGGLMVYAQGQQIPAQPQKTIAA